MELTGLKQIKNGMIPTEQPTIEEKVASGIGVEGTTGLSTLTDRKYIKNLPKFGDGLVSRINKWGNESNAMFGSNAGAVMSAAPAAIDFVGSISSGTKYNKTADDLLQDAGGALGNIGGVSYQTQNEIDESQVAAQEHAENKANTIGLMGKGASLGASIGSVAGPVGGLIGGAVGAIGGLVGGLFGGGRRHAAMRRRIAEAQNRALRQNDFSRNGALTSVLQLNYAREYGDTESQSLYGFANGKSTWSAAGSVGLGANARVSNGEIIANKYTGEMFRVPGLPNNKDGKLAFIRPSDTIISNKYGLSDYVASTGDLEGGEAMQGMIMKSLGKKGYKNGKQSYIQNDATRVQTPHTTFKIKRNKNFSDSQYFWNSGPMYPSGLWRLNDGSFSAIKPENGERIYFPQEVADSIIRNNIRKQEVEKFNNVIRNNEYKNGKLPGFSIGKWGVPEWANFTGNIIPMIATGAEYLRSKSEPLGSYTATHSNPNASIASNMMLQRRYNPYPSYRNVWDLYAKNNYASNNSGLSSSQRNLRNLAVYSDTLDNIYKINDHAQQMNNQYLGENAQFLDNQGRFNAQLGQTDDIKHYDTYTQSHGAADLRNSTLLSQFGNLFQNYSKGVSDLWTTNKILNYYDQQENEKRKNNTTQYPSFTIDLSARDYVLGNLKYGEDDLNSDLRQHNIMPKPITQEELNARQMVPGTPTYFKDIESYLLKKATKLRKKSTNRKKS